MSSKPLFFSTNQADPPHEQAEDKWRDYAFEYCLIVIGPDTRVLSTQSSENWPLSFDARAVIGHALTELIHPHDQPVLLRMIAESARMPGTPLHAQLRFGTRDAHHWVLVILGGKTVPGAEGLEVQLVPTRNPGHLLDDLVERESRWNYALVGSELGVWDHNFRTGTYFYSDVWKAMRGIPTEEEVNPDFDHWIRNIHPDDQARVIEAVAGQNAGDERYQVFEYRERHRDGHYIWIECRGSVVEWDPEGTPMRVVGTDTDITRRKEDEARLEKLSQRLEMALDVSQIGVFEADLDTGMADWDDNVLKIFGLEGTEHLKPFNV